MAEVVVEEAGFDMMETYIWRRRNTVTQYIPIQNLTGFKIFHFEKIWGWLVKISRNLWLGCRGYPQHWSFIP